MNMKCLVWNLEWRTVKSPSGKKIQEIIKDIDADVVCYTEVTESMVPDGHIMRSNAEYGYRNNGDRRKVVLWSRYPWTEIDTLGCGSLPPGRFASGITNGVRFVGVCIPWRDAHVASGRRDRKPWQDHLEYLGGLADVLKHYSDQSVPVCLLGDYNQKIPRNTQPFAVAEALAATIPNGFTIATSGLKDMEGELLVDHFSCSHGLSIEIQEIVPKVTPEGLDLSDHPGVVATLSRTSTTALL
jgi:endonuclease/exonuclease/phosphatase family metal-dependent hydrolase